MTNLGAPRVEVTRGSLLSYRVTLVACPTSQISPSLTGLGLHMESNTNGRACTHDQPQGNGASGAEEPPWHGVACRDEVLEERPRTDPSQQCGGSHDHPQLESETFWCGIVSYINNHDISAGAASEHYED